MLGCQSVQHVDIHFDSRDDRIVQESFQQVMDVSAGFHLLYGLTNDDIMTALKAAHIAADEYYTVRHALTWNTDFVVPVAAIEADSNLFQSCRKHFAAMCRHKQQLLAQLIFGPTTYFLHFRANRATHSRSNHARFQHITRIRDKWHNAVGISWLQTRIYQCSSIT